MSEDNARRVRTSITIKPEILESTKAMSVKRGVSVSRFIEEALAAQFDNTEDEVPAHLFAVEKL